MHSSLAPVRRPRHPLDEPERLRPSGLAHGRAVASAGGRTTARMDSVTQTIQAALGRQPEMQEPLIAAARTPHSQATVDESEEVGAPLLSSSHLRPV